MPGSSALIVCPLGVRQEFVRDAKMLGIKVRFIRSTDELLEPDTYADIYLTNYESVREGKVDVSWFTAVSLDEASVLRSCGSKTYQTVLAFDAWPYGEKPVFVLSTRALAAPPPGAVVERMSGAPADIVSRLAARGVGHVYVDGGITIQRFLQAGLIQRLIITRVPVLIGAGIPLFGALPRDIVVKHVATRQYASGLVQSEYVVAA